MLNGEPSETYCFCVRTVRSGTTMLNLFLGNKQQRSMVLGEVANLFYPRLQMHYDKIEVLNKEEGVAVYFGSRPQ